MPYSGGVYSLPAGGPVAGTEASATDVTTLTDDLEAAQNANRPIVAGGTGADTAAGARTNLAVPGKAATETISGDWTVTGSWTFAGTTIADLGAVTTIDINGGTIDGAVIGGSTAAAGTFTDASADNFYVEPGGATGGGAVAQITTNGDDIRIVPTDGAGGYDADNWLTFQYTNSRWAFAGNVRLYGGLAQESGETVQFAGAADSYVGNETTGQGVSVNTNAQLAVAVGSGVGPAFSTNRVDDSGNHIGFFKNGSSIAFISESGGTITYGTGSDYRLKENVTDLTDALERLKQIRPVRFNLIGYPGRTIDGFLAHEFQAVIPEAVSGEKDEVDAEGNPVMQNVDYGKAAPLLVAALQEALARIEALEAAR